MDFILKFYSIFLIIIQLNTFVTLESNYNLDLTNYQVLPESQKEWCEFVTFRLAKIAKNTFAISGSATLHKNIGNNEKISYAVYKKALNQEFNDKPIIEKIFQACDFIEKDKLLYAQMTEKSNLPKEPVCPLPKNSYTFNKWSYDPHKLPSFIPPGDYKVVFKALSNKNELLFGVEVFGSVLLGA